MTIRKAIIPVAGLGTRFLPATKAQPKEMLTLVDKPTIQLVVEEAVAAGITEIIIVTSQNKRAIEDHFDRNFELEERLREKGKMRELAMLEHINTLASFAFVRQQKPLGDGHAILSALPFIDPDESVVVMYGDDVFDAVVPVTKQLIDAFDKFHDPIIALHDVGLENVEKYGIAGGDLAEPGIFRIDDYVEKPRKDEAKSSFAGVGRYIVTPSVFRQLKQLAPGPNGEIGLTAAFQAHLHDGGRIFGRIVDGRRFDCGNKLEFMKAAVEMALKHPEVNGDGAFARFLADISRQR